MARDLCASRFGLVASDREGDGGTRATTAIRRDPHWTPTVPDPLDRRTASTSGVGSFPFHKHLAKAQAVGDGGRDPGCRVRRPRQGDRSDFVLGFLIRCLVTIG